MRVREVKIMRYMNRGETLCGVETRVELLS